MISICIPVYNYDVTALVNCLHSAIKESEVYREIIIGSDGCDDAFLKTHSLLENLDRVSLVRSEKNIGRSAIRNQLVKRAGGDFILFLDADALIHTDVNTYLTTYLIYTPNYPVICGGVEYRNTEPVDPDRYLRWRYGINREMKSARTRNKNPYASFSGFNFIVRKDLLKKFKFNEALVQYGHEDTLFGYQLRKAGVKLIHIDNSLIHDGIEPNRIFLLKSQEGIANLSKLYDLVTDRKTLIKTVKLLKVHRLIRLLFIDRLINYFFVRHRRRFEIVIRSRKTNLKMFDLYKLSLFCHYRIVKPES